MGVFFHYFGWRSIPQGNKNSRRKLFRIIQIRFCFCILFTELSSDFYDCLLIPIWAIKFLWIGLCQFLFNLFSEGCKLNLSEFISYLPETLNNISANVILGKLNFLRHNRSFSGSRSHKSHNGKKVRERDFCGVVQAKAVFINSKSRALRTTKVLSAGRGP